MTPNKRHTLPALALALAMLACTLPAAGQNNAPTTDLNNPAAIDGAAATITALAATIQAQNNVGGGAPSVTPTVAVAAETVLPTETPTITQTLTPAVAVVGVSVATNCRTGPGTEYDIRYTLDVNVKAELAGKYTAGNYWIIKIPGGDGSLCWLWGQYAVTEGNTAALPEYTPPPTPAPTFTPTPSLPEPPKQVAVAKACVPVLPALVQYQYFGTLTWKDMSNNEQGFRIYMNGGQIGAAGPNATAFALPGLPFPIGTPITWSVEAFNAAGASTKKQVVMSCP